MGLFLPADATFRRLTYNDFLTVNRPPPAPGTTATAAQTQVGHRFQPNTFTFERSSFLAGNVFTLREDPSVFVELRTGQPGMFVASWVFLRPQTFQNELLNHEQGHYEIGMLNAKDVFFELQRIQTSSFATAREGVTAIRTMQTTLGNTQAIHDKYDRDTRNGTNPALQTAWDAALSAARTTFTAPSLRVALRTAGLFP